MRCRADLRHLAVCSVDPPGCKDIDDALHVRRLPNGNFELGVSSSLGAAACLGCLLKKGKNCCLAQCMLHACCLPRAYFELGLSLLSISRCAGFSHRASQSQQHSTATL